MVYECQYAFCSSNSSRIPGMGMIFVRFPQPEDDLAACRRWVIACARRNLSVEDISPFSFLCELHFPDKAVLDLNENPSLEPIPFGADDKGQPTTKPAKPIQLPKRPKTFGRDNRQPPLLTLSEVSKARGLPLILERKDNQKAGKLLALDCDNSDNICNLTACQQRNYFFCDGRTGCLARNGPQDETTQPRSLAPEEMINATPLELLAAKSRQPEQMLELPLSNQPKQQLPGKEKDKVTVEQEIRDDSILDSSSNQGTADDSSCCLATAAADDPEFLSATMEMWRTTAPNPKSYLCQNPTKKRKALSALSLDHSKINRGTGEGGFDLGQDHSKSRMMADKAVCATPPPPAPLEIDVINESSAANDDKELDTDDETCCDPLSDLTDGEVINPNARPETKKDTKDDLYNGNNKRPKTGKNREKANPANDVTYFRLWEDADSINATSPNDVINQQSNGISSRTNDLVHLNPRPTKGEISKKDRSLLEYRNEIKTMEENRKAYLSSKMAENICYVKDEPVDTVEDNASDDHQLVITHHEVTALDPLEMDTKENSNAIAHNLDGQDQEMNQVKSQTYQLKGEVSTDYDDMGMTSDPNKLPKNGDSRGKDNTPETPTPNESVSLKPNRKVILLDLLEMDKNEEAASLGPSPNPSSSAQDMKKISKPGCKGQEDEDIDNTLTKIASSNLEKPLPTDETSPEDNPLRMIVETSAPTDSTVKKLWMMNDTPPTKNKPWPQPTSICMGTYWTLYRLYFEIFRDKETTEDWCMTRKLIASKVDCPVCEHPMELVKEHRRRVQHFSASTRRWLCHRAINGVEHQREVYLFQNSIFDDPRVTLQKAILLIYFWSSNYPTDIAAKEGEIEKPVVSSWYQKLRNLVHQYMTVNPKLFGGEGATVEVDLFSWSKNNGPFILGGVARHSGKKPRECFFEVVKNTEQKTLLPIVKKYVKPGTTVISSCFKDETKQMETVQPFNHVSISSSQRKLMPKVPDLLLILSLWDSLRARIAAHGSMMNSNRAHDSMWPSVLSNSLWLELHSDAFDATLQTIADVYKF